MLIPIPKRHIINKKSISPDPESDLKIHSKGPPTPFDKKPVVGDPPLIHALSGVVANPGPKSLSKKPKEK